MKTPVIQRDHYTVYYEGIALPDEGVMVFVHCDVYQWSPLIKRRLKADFNALTAMRQHPVYCARHDPKQEKFIKMFGFGYSYSVPEHQIDIYVLEI